MAGNLLAAINQAQAICWDESIGYRVGGMAYSSADGVDCSGLIGRCLYDNGFNYPSYHVGTADMVANSMSPVDASPGPPLLSKLARVSCKSARNRV